MAGKRYYWLKLHDDFFASKRIKKLRKMAGGDTYTIIYLKIQLLAMKTDGIINFTGLEDNFADELALDIDESADDVRVTIAYLLACGLAESSDNISFFFPYSVENVGSEKAGAERMRRCREKQKMSQCDTTVTPLLQNGDGEIEKEIEIEKDIEIEKSKSNKPVRHKYGEYANVLLSDDELDKWKAECPSDWSHYIESLSEYIASSGKSYKNFLATLRNWYRRDTEKNAKSQSKPQKQVESTASYDIDEFAERAIKKKLVYERK